MLKSGNNFQSEIQIQKTELIEIGPIYQSYFKVFFSTFCSDLENITYLNITTD